MHQFDHSMNETALVSHCTLFVVDIGVEGRLLAMCGLSCGYRVLCLIYLPLDVQSHWRLRILEREHSRAGSGLDSPGNDGPCGMQRNKAWPIKQSRGENGRRTDT